MYDGTFWTIVSFFLAAVTVGFALIFSAYMFSRTSASLSYADLDRMYADVLKIGMDNPDFRDPEKTSRYGTAFSGSDLIRYGTYAFMVWNVCETIYDRTSERTRRTWDPVIRTEMGLHRAWIDDPANCGKFKDEFLEYVRGLGVGE